jgi:serine/threonine protein kinase
MESNMTNETDALSRVDSILVTEYQRNAASATSVKEPSTTALPVPNNEDELSQLLQQLENRNSAPVTSISSFMALVTVVNPPFKPRTLHRPWSISAGTGQFGAVEVHRYVPKRNFDVFNDKSPIKLNAYEPDGRRTGDYYAVKRLTTFSETESTSLKPGPNPFAQLADELRILGHKDLHGHPNLLFLFGVSHSPSRSQSCLAEPNLVLQEGDCGDLHSFYRDSDLRFNQHTLVETKMSICFDISVGLEAMHHHGVVHCDLKPKNILIRRRNGRRSMVSRFNSESEAAEVAVNALVGQSPFIAVLADFGGSLIFSDTDAVSMRSKVWTPFWSAPECYARVPISKGLLPKIDIYAAGLIFAFIILEGQDIFTRIVERGERHSQDVTMDSAAVKELKLADGVLKLAKEQVQNFESSFFALYADGHREYKNREIMYAPPQIRIFHALLETSLHADPARRVSNATNMLNPWKEALRSNFHLANNLFYSQPALFRSYRDGSRGPVKYFEQAKTCVK